MEIDDDLTLGNVSKDRSVVYALIFNVELFKAFEFEPFPAR